MSSPALGEVRDAIAHMVGLVNNDPQIAPSSKQDYSGEAEQLKIELSKSKPRMDRVREFAETLADCEGILGLGERLAPYASIVMAYITKLMG